MCVCRLTLIVITFLVLLSTMSHVSIWAHEVGIVNLLEHFLWIAFAWSLAVVIHVYFVGISRNLFHLNFVLCNHFHVSLGSFYLIHVIAVCIGYLEVLLVIFELLLFFVRVSFTTTMINAILGYHGNKLDLPILKWILRYLLMLRLWTLVGLFVVSTLGLLTITSAIRRWVCSLW